MHFFDGREVQGRTGARFWWVGRPNARTQSARLFVCALVALFTVHEAVAATPLDVGSNGSDGDFHPTTDVTIDMSNHPDGIYHYKSVLVPEGVTVRFKPNAANKPVVWLVQGDVVIQGTVNLDGESFPLNVDSLWLGLGTAGGPGGFAGGSCTGLGTGQPGSGPGAGKAGNGVPGGHGSFASKGTVSQGRADSGEQYGSPSLIPLVGGSGGGGGDFGGRAIRGAGGGGAFLIAASSRIRLDGKIEARGGTTDGIFDRIHVGGNGSGGAVRLLAATVEGAGQITVTRGQGDGVYEGGGDGWVRIDAGEDLFKGTMRGVFTRGSNLVTAATASAPKIGQQPNNQTVSAGGFAVFSVGVVGSDPLIFQWYRNGVALVNAERISGANSASLLISNVRTSDAGTYVVAVTNSYGAVQSNPVLLTVDRLGQSINFPALPDRSVTEFPLTVAATASSGLPVQFEVISGPAKITGSTLDLQAPGIITIRATQSGNEMFLPAMAVERSFRANACPELAILTPSVDTKVRTGIVVPVRWDGRDVDDDARTSLFYDSDDNPANGNEIVIFASDPRESGLFEWDTRGVSPGSYRLLGLLSDGHCETWAYSPGKIMVVENACPELRISAPTADTTVRVGVVVSIRWEGNDPDDAARMSLFYDPDDEPANGNEKVIFASDPRASGVFGWDTSNVVPGTYRLLGILSDGKCDKRIYGRGFITIVKPGTTVFEPDPIEITQAIQTRDNRLPLVAGKRTVARVYAKITDRDKPEPVRVRLTGSRNGTILDPAPPEQVFLAPPLIDREQLKHSAVFLLPDSWSRGNVELQATIMDNGVPIVSSRTVRVSFMEKDPLTVWVIPVNFGTKENPLLADEQWVQKEQQYFQSVFPANVVFVRKSWDKIGPFSGTEILDALASYRHNLQKDWSSALQSTGAEPFRFPDAIYGFTPKLVRVGPDDDEIVAGVAYLGSKVGTGSGAGAVMVHEVNHCLDSGFPVTWGRHVSDPNSNSSANPKWGCGASGGDGNWKWDNDHIQDVGFDTHNLKVIPASFPDFMSYCSAGQPPFEWISTYRWERLFDYTGIIKANARSLMTLQNQANQRVLYVSGTVNADGTGTLDPVVVRPGIPEDSLARGDYAIDLLDARRTVLLSLPFSVLFEDSEGHKLKSTRFSLRISERAGTSFLVLKHAMQPLAEIRVSDQPPTVRIVAPNGGESWDGIQTISWEAADADSAALTFHLSYSPNDGRLWLPISIEAVRGNSYTVDTSMLPGGEKARIRIVVSDGFNTAVDESDENFTVKRKTPKVSIISPADGTYDAGAAVSFEAEAEDLEDVSLPGSAYVWFDGSKLLGTGKRLTTSIPEGTHMARVKVTDSDGNTAEASVNFRVGIRIASIEAKDNTLTLAFLAIGGQSYTVHHRSSLGNSSWQVLSKILPQPQDRMAQVVETLSGSDGERYYQISTP